MTNKLISRWSVTMGAALAMALAGCAKKEDKAARDAPIEASDTGGANPSDQSAVQGGDKGSDTKPAGSRHEVMVENAKNAIPTIAKDERTNAAAAAADPEVAKAQADLAKTAAGDKQAKPASVLKVADTKTYTVTVHAPTGKANKDSSLQVVVKPKAGWKLNMEFPTKLKLEPPAGVTVAKKTLKKGDATVFSEKKGATWKVGYKAASAGDKKFSGKLKFAVCTEATCDPKSETLAFNVSVK